MAEAGPSQPGPNNEDNEEIVLLSGDQREAEPGEPTCIMCGRYGAYICDATDQDVCSVQCKREHLARVQKSNPAKDSASTTSQLDIYEQFISDERCKTTSVAHYLLVLSCSTGKCASSKLQSYPPTSTGDLCHAQWS